MALRLGLGLPQTGGYELRTDVTAAARAAEELGYDSVWVLERLMRPEQPVDDMYLVPGLPWSEYFRSVADPLVTLSLAAAVTERVKLGSAVLVGPLHQPFLLARALGSLDAASGGRVIAGLGTGWSRDEYAAAGADHASRGRALDELLDVCEAVWGEDPASYEGERTRFTPSAVGPKPAARIPVLLAGRTDRALRRLVRRADGWLPSQTDNAGLATTRARLAGLAAEYGRDPATLAVTVRAFVQLSDRPVDGERRIFQGSLEQIVEDLAGAVRAGADEVLLDTQLSNDGVQALIESAKVLREAVTEAGL
ncbi:TIGR03619 family F420-dependent LLM class oxidoreductase [Streptomyces sp. NBC_01795]|uniref:TIGR03619 family F420-dependent LLM class oxidoreductase n=1 Tax=unclassified Streptomyces TaxID=2593676 RepID=UPI002DD8EA1E|nr:MULTISPECIES: TIGR03619 family F420-dependent LLM class oxidoreductase [unclassified Streptomyces]WSA96368.1 TIGR03619 family F420-dependent LLM class oxidoreductase [Streptomyces sp. NBC_01795]WSB80782.1 TIGR03619 family F420-dependent LLM class oxidoreductase [Streptomyces sp. NBC_01775]